MGRSQWICTVEGCRANPSKRNNIERHVWLQHARKWHYGDKPEPYMVGEHKHLVEPYIKRSASDRRGDHSSERSPSPITPPVTPPGSPSTKKHTKSRSLLGLLAVATQEDRTALHTPQPTPHGSPIMSKSGRALHGTKSAPGSPYLNRRQRREELSSPYPQHHRDRTSEYTTPQFSREKGYTTYPDYSTHESDETPEWRNQKVQFSATDSVASDDNGEATASLPFMYHYSGDETRCSGLDFLAMACNTFSLQGDADIALDPERPAIKANDEMWRPW